jgi:Fe-S cluster biogenesis protein NfuA/nitrite reductase/ring-hydroxylating ferredoxin subunit
VNVDAVGRRVEDLLDQIAGRDEVAAELTEELVRELMALYGAGLGRVLDRMAAAAPDALRDLTADPLVGGLLVLHDLHPDDVGARVEAALEQVRPYLASHGGGVQLLGVTGDVALLRLEGSCDGCGSSQITLQHAVEGAVLDAAPEIDRIEVEGAVGTGSGGNGLIPAESLSLRRRVADAGWEPLPEPAVATDDTASTREVNGTRVAVVRLGDQLFAYRDACPACGGSLDGGRLRDEVLACPACEVTYDVRHAGAAVGGGTGLSPVPLLADGADVRVAVGALR